MFLKKFIEKKKLKIDFLWANFGVFIDNKIIKSSNKINELFDLLIENNSLDKEVKNLIIYKKALYNSEFVSENILITQLKPLINFGASPRGTINLSACSNMLSMSTADVLVASRSTFSIWSYFLSNQNTYLPKGSNLSHIISDVRNIEYV